MADFTPTDEQLNILKSFKARKNLKIHAFAGTGKTTTLEYLAGSTRKKGLYIAFNKRVAKEAQKRMPRNVSASTIHSVAWKWASETYPTDKLMKSPSRKNLSDTLDLPNVTGFSSYKVASTISLILSNFGNSRDKQITVSHIPWRHPAYLHEQTTLKRFSADLTKTAREAWALMCDVEARLPLGHDGYLKLWSLNSPKLEYDFLMVDEAQDLSPVMLEIIDAFEGQKILVGDSQQQIYSWRGAVDAMQHDIGGVDHYLSHTFRFGADVSSIANKVLRTLQVDKPIVSMSKTGTKLRTEDGFTADAYIFRKNASLIGKAVEMYQRGDNYYIVDPNKNIEESVDDYFRLNDGLFGKSNAFQGYNSWDRVVAIAKKEDLNPFRGFVELFEMSDPEIIREAVKASQRKEAESYPSLTTGHQAKGLEWEKVSISDDFSLSSEELSGEKADEELRLLYVAMTRAKSVLNLPATLKEFCESHLGSSLQRFAVIDLETTGLSPEDGDRITEVGFVVWQNGKVIDQFQSLVNPGRSIPRFVQDLTGITDAMVRNAPSSKEVLSEAFAKLGKMPLVAHNASFERKFINHELSEISSDYQIDLVCSLLLARRIFPNANGYKLGDLVSLLKLPKGKAHRALSDAEMTAHLMTKIAHELEEKTHGEFLLTADNLLRVTKAQPREFRDHGLQVAYKNARNKYAKTRYKTYDFTEERDTLSQNAKQSRKISGAVGKKSPVTKTVSYEKRAYEAPEWLNEKRKLVSARDKSRAKRGGLIGLTRKILKTINWLFFGLLILGGVIVLFTEPGKFGSLVLILILYGIGTLISTGIDKLFG